MMMYFVWFTFLVSFLGCSFCSELEDILERLQARSHQLNGDGPTFVRWGRSHCPPTSEKVYDGYMAGPKYNVGGSGSNHLCLPQNPEFGDYTPFSDGKRGALYGVEIETKNNKPFSDVLQDQDAACVICQTIKRKSVLMIPGLLSCPYGWHSEYNGYLVASASATDKHRSEYVCFDGSPVGLPGYAYNNNEALIVPVEVMCGTLDCKTYPNFRELTCVVCSR